MKTSCRACNFGLTNQRWGLMLPAAMLALCFLAIPPTSALADNIVVSENPWGQNFDTTNMGAVFGASYTLYGSFAAANPASIFTASNQFVFLEGGDGTQPDWANYISTNSSAILNWVNSGGDLLVMSAGWFGGSTTIGPGTLNNNNYSSCGTLTAAGTAALTFQATPTNQCGNYIAHDSITGAGLTDFMDGNGMSILAGTQYGSGYIMYSGLTDSQWHYGGTSLVTDVVAFTAAQGTTPVPEPGSLSLLGTGFMGVVEMLRRRRQRA